MDAKAELLARYRQSLPEKLKDLALAWEAWLADPDQGLARERFHTLVHKLAGSAPAYGYEDLGREARRIDSALQSWVGDAPEARTPLPDLVRRIAVAAESLLRTLGRAAREIAAADPDAASSPPGEHAVYVLFLEDDREQGRYWRDALMREGLRVRLVDSLPGLEADLVLETPDILLIDFWLDGHTAGDVARELGSMPEFSALPKICLTVDDGTLPRQVAMDSGFAAVVRKTIQPSDLAQLLRQTALRRD